MNHIFYLSGDFTDLAREEILSLFRTNKHYFSDRIFIVNADEQRINKKIKRLALTKSSYKLLFECKTGDLIAEIRNFDWNSVYEKNFCVRIYKSEN